MREFCAPAWDELELVESSMGCRGIVASKKVWSAGLIDVI